MFKTPGIKNKPHLAAYVGVKKDTKIGSAARSYLIIPAPLQKGWNKLRDYTMKKKRSSQAACCECHFEERKLTSGFVHETFLIGIGWDGILLGLKSCVGMKAISQNQDREG